MALTVNPNAYLNYNPLLETDLSHDVSYHRLHGYKNEILAIISIVAFLALSIVGLWWAAFFALEMLPCIIAASGAALKVVHSLFFHPYRLEAAKHWEALALTTATIENLSTLREEDVPALEEELGVTHCDHPHKSLLPVYAKYKALKAESDSILQRIQALFYAPAEFSTDHTPQNYQATKEAFTQNPLKFHRKLRIYEANWYKLQDQYLEKRMQEIFLAYVASQPFRTGTFKNLGFFLPNREPADQLFSQQFHTTDIPFFIFRHNGKALFRTHLLRCHKEANFNEKLVNQHFIKIFANHDHSSLQAVITRALSQGSLDGDILPSTFDPNRSLEENLDLCYNALNDSI